MYLNNWSRETAEKGKAFVAHISSEINLIYNDLYYHFHLLIDSQGMLSLILLNLCMSSQLSMVSIDEKLSLQYECYLVFSSSECKRKSLIN